MIKVTVIFLAVIFFMFGIASAHDPRDNFKAGIDADGIYLTLLHGFYNSLVIALFIYQGFIGLTIKKERKIGSRPFHIIKRHIKLGTILTIGSIIGFFSGILVVFLNHGDVFKYPLHFMIGVLIILSVITMFLISKKIKKNESMWRTIHFRLGIFMLCLYIIQAFFGLGMLL